MTHAPVPEVLAYRLMASDGIPNHPHWPVLVYPSAVAIEGPDPAIHFERLFTRHGWPAAWRNGVYAFAHFHSNAHEALGIYSGEVSVQVGGEDGVIVHARAGDVLVLPAGTSHKRIATRGALGVVGAYPFGQSPDLCRPSAASLEQRQRSVLAVPCPHADPVSGSQGPLTRLWERISAGQVDA